MKHYKFWTLDLNTKNNLESGFKKRHSDVTKKDLKEALKELIERTRRQAKAKKRNWKFCVFAVISNQHLSEQRAGAWHIHLIIYGSPASRIAKEMKAYWTSHNYGNPPQQNIRVCDDWKKLRYNIHQWLMNEQCEARFYTHGLEIQDLRDSLIKQYPKETDWQKIFKDLMMDGDRLTQWGFVGFAMSSKDGWKEQGESVTE